LLLCLQFYPHLILENRKLGKLENLETWKTGKLGNLENWKTGKLGNGKIEKWKNRKMENWENWEMEKSKNGKMDKKKGVEQSPTPYIKELFKLFYYSSSCLVLKICSSSLSKIHFSKKSAYNSK